MRAARSHLLRRSGRVCARHFTGKHACSDRISDCACHLSPRPHTTKFRILILHHFPPLSPPHLLLSHLSSQPALQVHSPAPPPLSLVSYWLWCGLVGLTSLAVTPSTTFVLVAPLFPCYTASCLSSWFIRAFLPAAQRPACSLLPTVPPSSLAPHPPHAHASCSPPWPPG